MWPEMDEEDVWRDDDRDSHRPASSLASHRAAGSMHTSTVDTDNTASPSPLPSSAPHPPSPSSVLCNFNVDLSSPPASSAPNSDGGSDNSINSNNDSENDDNDDNGNDDEDDDNDFELIGGGHIPEARFNLARQHQLPGVSYLASLWPTRRTGNSRESERSGSRYTTPARTSFARMESGSNSNDYNSPDWPQAGEHADQQDLAGPGAQGRLECTVSGAQKEGEGTQNPYVSYLVATDTDFKSYQSSHSTVRRRFTDFVFLYRTLAKEYPQCAVPPLPDKHNMSYVRGDRFGPDFTARRGHSLNRFLKRLTLHPVLRRATILTLFLESSDWNAVMKSRPNRGMSGSDSGNNSVLESWTDSFLNAFTKPHKTDKRFQDVNDRASKLDDDLGTVSKTVARVAKRESDLEGDYAELATQLQKLAALEPGVQDSLTQFADSVQSTSEGWKGLKDHTDQDYLGSLKDMEAYMLSIKALLKTREQKQLDFEGLTEYLHKAAQERDTLASHGSVGASGFLRQKIEDVRGVDHEQSRRERQRKLEVQINRLTTEVEAAKKTSEAFDEEVVKEVADFERIKAVEFRDALGGLADANIDFFKGNVEIWERFVADMEKQQQQQAEAVAQAA